MTPMEAIQAATRNAAQALGRESDVGAIAVGRYGDIIAVDGDPLADVRAARGRRRGDQGRRGGEERLTAAADRGDRFIAARRTSPLAGRGTSASLKGSAGR